MSSRCPSEHLEQRISDDSTVNPIIENYIKFYHICIKYLDSSLTTDDSLRVDSLAGLCPTTDGYVVFKARALYNLLYDDMKLFVDGCTDYTEEEEEERGMNPQNGASRFGLLTSAGGQAYSLLPNPNNGNFTIVQQVAEDEAVKAEVWNAVGLRVYKGNLDFVAKKADLKLSGIAPGNYMLKLIGYTGRYYTLKFTVL